MLNKTAVKDVENVTKGRKMAQCSGLKELFLLILCKMDILYRNISIHRPIVVLVVALLSFFCVTAKSGTTSSVEKLLDSLHATIKMRDTFVAEKELAISALKKVLNTGDSISDDEICRVNNLLFDHYHKYQVDSAIACTDRVYEAAMRMGNRDKAIAAAMNKSLELSMCSRFLEADAILKDIEPAHLDSVGRRLYYEAIACLRDFYTASSNAGGFSSSAYRDSLANYLNPATYKYHEANESYIAWSDSVKGEEFFERMMAMYGPESPEHAMLTYMYATVCLHWGDRNRALEYYIRSAISDIRNCTRETLSLQRVASLRYDDGYYRDAYDFTMVTISDIKDSGISFRGPDIYNNYSIIVSTLREEERRSRNTLQWLSTVCIVGVLILVVVSLFLYRLMKRNLRIKRELAESNLNLSDAIAKLNSINELLNEKNTLLYENNQAKESYIAEFFDVCFHYIDKVEQMQKSLYKLAVSRSFDALTRRLQSDEMVSAETSELYRRFDSIFLKLYPTFIDDFNRLLRDEEKIKLHPRTLLTRELRIYALMRLGITDSGKIAAFLRCSTSTIYNYRTRMRKRAVDRDCFEENIMKIKAAHDL